VTAGDDVAFAYAFYGVERRKWRIILSAVGLAGVTKVAIKKYAQKYAKMPG
jgi:hypothetical protein